jgi:hypothetical protein
VILAVPVHPPADLRHPQRDPVMLEQRRHRREPVPVERPLMLPDHDRVPPALRILQRSHQRSGLRPPRPRQLPGLPDIEKLRHDHPVPRSQHHRLLQLPRPRRHRILPVLGRDPPVKHEPQTPPATNLHPAAPPGPRRQRAGRRLLHPRSRDARSARRRNQRAPRPGSPPSTRPIRRLADRIRPAHRPHRAGLVRDKIRPAPSLSLVTRRRRTRLGRRIMPTEPRHDRARSRPGPGRSLPPSPVSPAKSGRSF